MMDNIDKIIKNINIDLEQRVAGNKENYYFQLNLFKKKYSIKESYIRGKENNFYIIDDKKDVKFTFLNNKIIGNSENIKQHSIIGLKFNYNEFTNCTFDNIKFTNCSFYGTSFLECIFNSIVFEDCYFSNTSGSITIFDKGCTFIDCKFESCNMEKDIFRDTNINNTKFILTNLKNTIFSNVSINSLHIKDCDMRAIKIINSFIKELEFKDDFLTKLDKDSFIDEILINEKEGKIYDQISKIYREIASKFEANRLVNSSGEYYYLSKKTEHKTLMGLEKVKSYIFWMLCGYGERPTYALITSLEIVLIFTIIYMFTGLDAGGEMINYSIYYFKDFPTNDLTSDFIKSLYFSIATFTTVGYGDITPIGYSILLSGIQMFLGVTMVGVWTATLARKITR